MPFGASDIPADYPLGRLIGSSLGINRGLASYQCNTTQWFAEVGTVNYERGSREIPWGKIAHPLASLRGARSCTKPGLSSGTLGYLVNISLKRRGENLSFPQWLYNVGWGREVVQTLFLSELVTSRIVSCDVR